MNKDLFCKGYTWGFFSGSGAFQTPEAERSMELLAANGLNWICIPVNCFQETYYSLSVFSLFGRTQTDDEQILHPPHLRTLRKNGSCGEFPRGDQR